MRRDKKIRLIPLDARGGELPGREVLAEANSITAKAFLAAAEENLKPALMLRIWAFEYQDENLVEYSGKRLEIYRTYKKGRDLELYCREAGGVRAYGEG